MDCRGNSAFSLAIGAVLLVMSSLMSLGASAPLPSGSYATAGMPAFYQGTFVSLDKSTVSTIIPGQGSVLQTLLANSSINTIISSPNSYECIDQYTFRAEGNLTALPSLIQAGWCGIFFTNGTHLIGKANPTLLGKCPDTLGLPLLPGEQISVSILTPGIVPQPTVTTCTTPGVPTYTNFPPPPPMAMSPPPASPQAGAPSPGQQRPAPVNLLPFNGSAQPQYGLWGTSGIFMYHSQENMCATRYEDGTLKAQVAQFESFQCNGPNSFYQTFHLSEYYAIQPTKPRYTIPICLSGSRDNVNNTLTVFMTAFGPCPAAVANGPTSPGVLDLIVSKLIDSIPGNPNITCADTVPITPPAPSTCTWKGNWKISPLYPPCAKKSFVFGTRACADNTVRIGETIAAGTSATFGLDHSWSEATGTDGEDDNTVVAVRTCPNTKLQGPGMAPQKTLSLSGTDFSWSIVPVHANDCTVVNLVAASDGANQGKFLQVPKTCDSFLWADKADGRTRFKLTKASELIG